MKQSIITTFLFTFLLLAGCGCQRDAQFHSRAKTDSPNLGGSEAEHPKGFSDIVNTTPEKEAEDIVAKPLHDTSESNFAADQTVAAEEAAASTDDVNTRNQQMNSHTVIAFYFHPTFRCQACLDVEALSKEAIESGFNKAIKNGDLIWLVLNFEEPDAKEFADEFSIDTSTLVIADMQGGQQTHWKKLVKVWELLNDRDSFVKYVQGEVAAYLRNN